MTSGHEKRARVLIYGSCVARDSYDHLDGDAFRLDRYVARQSLISAYAAPTALDEGDLDSLSSDFQRRTLRDDFAGSLHDDLATFGAGADLLLWDLTDERYGVWDLGGGRFVTRSVELVASGLDARLQATARLVRFGSRQHLTLWTQALRSFEASVRRAGLRRPPILIAPPWAEHDEHGVPVRSVLAPEPRAANRMMQKYVRRAGRVPTISLPGTSVSASSAHRWGPAPYHYTDDVYEEVCRGIVAALDAPPRS